MSYTGKTQGNDRAVSPVVGVMLMLVVVIIIAAVVSGFAGGLINSNSKAPQATIQATYSASAGVLSMYHAGGDELPIQNLYVVVRGIDAENGGYSGTMSRVSVNKSKICNSAGTICWQTPTGILQIPVWRSGEMMICNDSMKIMYHSGNGLDYVNTADIGKSFSLELDTTDGKAISKSTVKIVP